MCRITGIIDFNNASNRESEEPIKRMRDTMIAGGPDDCGTYQYQNNYCSVSLGHRRLSIIDTSINGHQPMVSDDASVVIIFNGEMYNYAEVRNELQESGILFKTQSDTEVVIQAYLKWGITSIHKFIGMFAFLLLDKKANRMYAVRDRAGVKPLYYYHHNNCILFGSELKCFHKHPLFTKEIEINSLALYFQLGYIPAPHSIFKHTKKLLPGHYLSIDLQTSSVEDFTYWNAIEYYQKGVISGMPLSEIVDKTESILQSACNYRMVADVPVGVFLSGGYDSSLVTSLLQKDNSKKIQTFTIGFNEKNYNEAPAAKKIADYLGTEHTEYYCTYKDALTILPTLPEIYDEPFGDSSAIPTILVSKVAGQSVKVALSADGGDELFGGYTRHNMVMNAANKMARFPKVLRQFSGEVINTFNPGNYSAAFEKKSFSKKANKFSKILQSENTAEMLNWLVSGYTSRQLGSIINEKLNFPLQTNFNHSRKLGKDLNDINPMLAIEYITYLPDDILAKVDRATMSVSLEGREPLLDHRIIEWMAQLPGNLKIHNGVQKYILKEITHKYIPKALMDRPKMGFGVPIINWFKNDLKEYFDVYLSREALQKHNLLNINYVEKKKAMYYYGNDSGIEELWFFLMFQMWYERWM